MNDSFFELIRVAIGNKVCLSRVPSAAEWNALYSLSVKQAVAGVCFCGVQRLPKEQLVEMPVRLKLQWFALATQIQQRNEQMNRRCVEVQRMLAKEGMRSSILKGQSIAVLYDLNLDLNLNKDDNRDYKNNLNLGLYRQCGDIDIYVPCGMEKALKWCRERYGDVDFDYINAHVPVFKDVEVELHWRVQSMTNLFKNRKLQRWLEREETKEMILGGKADMKPSESLQSSETSITVPSLEFNAFYLMLHCYHHVFESGLGLRQLMDYYFLLMAIHGTHGEHGLEMTKFSDGNSDHGFNGLNGDANAIANVNRLFKEFGMERFVGAVMWIMQEVFGLERERMLCEPDEKEGRYILDEVMAGGNFGHHDERIRKVGKGKWQSVFANLQHAIHVLRRYPQEALWMPVWMVYHFVWKRFKKIR